MKLKNGLVIYKMNKNQKLNYFGQEVEVVEFDKTHVVIMLESGSLLCTDINALTSLKNK
jgi:hypothetical protein